MDHWTRGMEADAQKAASPLLKRLIASLLLVTLLVGCLPGVAGAAERTNRGYSIAPVFQELPLAAAQPQVDRMITVQNRSEADQTFKLSAVDFGALDESGGVAFLGQQSGSFEHKYGLAAWMKLERQSVIVPAGGAAQVKLSIFNDANLAPGGHYGAVLATAETDGGTTSSKVGVRQVLSSLVLLVKEGGGVADLRLVSQAVAGLWWLPAEVEHRFYNAGGIHAVPRGVVKVKDPMGRLVARGAINEGSGIMLPESHRRYKTPLVKLAAGWLPGWYQVETTYRFDGTADTKTFTSGFWFAGSWVVWLALVVIMATIVAGIIWWRKRAAGRGRARGASSR